MEVEQFNEFFRGYLTAALWSSSDTHPVSGEQVELDDDDYKMTEECEQALRDDAKQFFDKHYKLLLVYQEERTFDPSQGTFWDYAGHDFWLTRNGHGTGFWDRGSDAGMQLADLVGFDTEFSTVTLYIGDDLMIHS